MAMLSDTSPEAEKVLIEVFRRISPQQKWLQLGETYDEGMVLHAAGVRYRNPAATSQDVHRSWLRMNLGAELADRRGQPASGKPMANLSNLRDVLRAFADLGIAHALGGSMASSILGINRYVSHANMGAAPFPGLEARVAQAFGPDYYLSEPAIRQAIQARSSFNIINTATGFKVDVFVCKDELFEKAALARRYGVQMPDVPEHPIVLYAAEDVVLFKLRWYRLGIEVAEQQWKDVLGVLKVQAGKLDEAHLDRWAAHLGVADLLARARQECAS